MGESRLHEVNLHDGWEHRFDSEWSSVPAWPLCGPVASSLESLVSPYL